MRFEVKAAGLYHPVALLRAGSPGRLCIDGREVEASLHQVEGARHDLAMAGCVHPVWIAALGEKVYVHAFGRAWELELVDPIERAAEQDGGRDNDVVRAPMPGLVVEVRVAAGERVAKGQTLMTIESMKLETVIQAPQDGELAEVHQQVGGSFDRGAPLVTFVAEG